MQERHNVLIVDDDPMQRRLLQTALRCDGSFHIYEARDGIECLAAVKRHRPDIVLLDVKMPRLDGIAACRRLRSMEQNRDLPIVLVTAMSDTSAINQGFKAGATDYLTKPVNMTLINYRVKALLQARQMQNELTHSKENFLNLQQELSLGYWIWDLEADQFSWSESLIQQFGLTRVETEPSRAAYLKSIHPEDRQVLEEETWKALQEKMNFSSSYRVVWPDGTMRTLYDQTEIIYNEAGKPVTVSGQVMDISEREEARKQITRMYYYDILTGLPNKVLFQEQLEETLHRTGREDSQCTVLCIGLDRFDKVYRSFGQSDGDQLLLLFSKRLVATLEGRFRVHSSREQKFIMARLHGARFVIFCPMCKEVHSNIKMLIRDILADILKIIELDGQELMLSGSIGTSNYPDHGDSAEELIKNAECAMEQARAVGGGQVCHYSPNMDCYRTQHINMESDIRKGLDRDEFLLHYQPQVELRSGRIVGVEALVRWHHPERGMVSPGKFIALCENTGLILPLSYQVMQIACRQQSIWQTEGVENLRIAVNISCKQVNDKSFGEKFLRFFDEIDVDPALFDLELTESCLMFQEEQLMQSLGVLKDKGVRIAIDDFGTGYSSLAYLESLPIDVLKIDRIFIQGIRAGKTAIINAILDMAKNLGLETVAEGIEHEEELTYLQENGADIIQGFLFARPMPAIEIPEFIQQWRINEHA